MKTPRDLLTVKLEAARRRRAETISRLAALDAEIADIEARKRARHTRELRRKAHWPSQNARVESEIAALLSNGALQ